MLMYMYAKIIEDGSKKLTRQIEINKVLCENILIASLKSSR